MPANAPHYNPLFALLETVRDELSVAMELHIGTQIDTRVNERPVAHSGDLFVGVFGNAMVDGASPDPEMGIDQTFSINISVTQRTGFIPDDKMLQHAAMLPQKDCLEVSQRITRHMQIRRLKIPRRASERLLTSEWRGAFIEPLKLSSSAITIRAIGPAHFLAEPPVDQKTQIHCQDYGLLSVITYSGARYMENIIQDTLDVVDFKLVTPMP